MAINSSGGGAIQFTPTEVLYDPTQKLRVAAPQSLIDTDFEYGTQTSKWENLGHVNNRPFAFQLSSAIANISSIVQNTGSRTVTVQLSTGTFPATGTPISVQDCLLNIANGNYIIESGGGSNQITYTARSTNTTSVTNLLDANKTAIYQGANYTQASIGTAGTCTFVIDTKKVTVTTPVPHGLHLGNEIAVVGITGTNPPNGSYDVASVPSPTTFSYYVQNAPSGLTTSSALVYVRNQAQFLHRPFDGGVIFSTNGNSNYETAIRQTRRYFRYQSGKGIQLSSGTILKPNLQLDSLSASGTTITVQTKERHNLQPGAQVTISGAYENAFNGTYAVSSVTGYNTFQYTALSTPSASPASGPYYASISGWYGAVTRLGMFDDQNGVFFEFDGQVLWAVKRSSNFQISGKVSVTNGSSTVTQSNASFPTAFSKQLTVGNRIVIRGQSYRVIDIASDTSMTISPAYRGATTTFAIVSQTIDTKYAQSSWNLDPANGNGSSGFSLDLSKMQMFYIDYTWYGAGTVRFGFRGADGNVFYVHKIVNANLNTESYMRSGNLPARYESNTNPPLTILNGSVLTGDTSITVANTSLFPPTGTLAIHDGTKYEYVNYTGKTTYTFTGLTRAQAGNSSIALTGASGSNSVTVSSASGLQVGMRVVDTVNNGCPEGTYISAINGTTLTLSQALTVSSPTVVISPMGATTAQAFSVTATSPISVELAFPSFAPSISHWGTSVIMDGRYDDDKSLLFTFGQNQFTNIASGASKALFSIRVSPSVDNGIPSSFGNREIINRMQLILRALDITTKTASSNMLVTAVLNGQVSSSTTWTNAVRDVATVTNSSLAQIADYQAGTTTLSGGETTGGFFVATTGSIDLNTVRDLGNSILGGGTTTANSGVYPDGPDVLTIVVQNLGASAVDVLGRLSWTEAQA